MSTSPLQPVPDSKGIAQMGYDDEAQKYHVQFKAGGPVYVYDDVTPETAKMIAEADSKGSAIRTHLVLPAMPFTKTDPPQDEEGEG